MLLEQAEVLQNLFCRRQVLLFLGLVDPHYRMLVRTHPHDFRKTQL